MPPMAFPSWRIAFIVHVFFHLASSAAVSLANGRVTTVTPVLPTAAIVQTLINGRVTTVTPVLATAPVQTGKDGTTNIVQSTVTQVLGSTTTPTPSAGSSTDTTSSSHSSSNPAIIVPSVSVGAIALLSLILCIIMRRRRALRTRTQQIWPAQGLGLESSKESRTHFDSESDVRRAPWAPDIGRDRESTRSSTISTRQLVISKQVDRAREKVAQLEEMSTLLRSSSNSSCEGRTRRASDLPTASAADESAHNTSDPDSFGSQDKLERAIRQIEGLNDRIRELERQRRSSWALGRSDEPPPGYTEDPV
ncbi:hypothetical protein B0H13DRAFT_2484416 [Mycena leptocephala]|nr:hypothetical protein B0H13DRAFT_2484416 [Mycena leptocephala]